jgi:hypothetical protein
MLLQLNIPITIVTGMVMDMDMGRIMIKVKRIKYLVISKEVKVPKLWHKDF